MIATKKKRSTKIPAKKKPATAADDIKLALADGVIESLDQPVDTCELYEDKQPFSTEKGCLIPRAFLVLNPWNYNEPTAPELEAIGESIDQYGQVVDILVRTHPEKPGYFQVIDGAHRAGNFADHELVSCTVISGLSDAEAMHLTAVMREARGTKANMPALGDLLKTASLELGADGVGIALPFSEDGLGSLLSLEPLTAPTNGEWEDATGKLPSGDKPPYQQVTLTLHDDQKTDVDRAMDIAKSQGGFDGPNKNINGNAIHRICQAFLEAHE